MCLSFIIIALLDTTSNLCVVDDFFFFKQKTAYEMRISDWSSDVCSSDLQHPASLGNLHPDNNAATGRCELDGIAHQIEQDLTDQAFVGPQQRQVGTVLNLHRQAGGGALLAQQPADLVGDIAHVDQAFVEFVMSCLDLRTTENVVEAS